MIFFFQMITNFNESSTLANCAHFVELKFNRFLALETINDACIKVKHRCEDEICNILNLSLRVIKVFNESFIKAI